MADRAPDRRQRRAGYGMTGSAEETDRVRAAYGSNYDHLSSVKRKYDPANLFRVNQNIAPA